MRRVRNVVYISCQDNKRFPSLCVSTLPLWVLGVLGNQVILQCKQAVILASDPQAEEQVLPESI